MSSFPSVKRNSVRYIRYRTVSDTNKPFFQLYILIPNIMLFESAMIDIQIKLLKGFV